MPRESPILVARDGHRSRWTLNPVGRQRGHETWSAGPAADWCEVADARACLSNGVRGTQEASGRSWACRAAGLGSRARYVPARKPPLGRSRHGRLTGGCGGMTLSKAPGNIAAPESAPHRHPPDLGDVHRAAA